MRFRLILVLLLVACVACSSDGASDDTSGASSTTTTTHGATTTAVNADEGEAPWGLDSVVLPDSPEAVEAVFTALPGTLGGMTRTDGPGRFEGAHEVEYGDAGRAIRATPLASIPTPGDDAWTPLAWLETMAGGMEGDVEGSVLEPDAPLAWIASAEQAGDETAYLAVWCVPNGSWYFDVVAESAGARLELIQTFIAAVESA
jgi:hypothetical protein